MKFVNKLKTNLLSKLFLIPSVLYIILSLLTLIIDDMADEQLTILEFIISDIIILLAWYIISFVISYIKSKLEKLKVVRFCINYFVYICITINFIIFIYIRISVIIENIFKSIIFTLLLIFPTLISIILLLLKRKNILKTNTINFLQIISICTSIIYIFILLAVGNFILAVDGVNNPINYRRVYYTYKMNRVSSLPNKVPKNAKNVKFHYNAPLFQGGEVFYLYFNTDHKSIKKYIEQYAKVARWINKYNSLDNNYYYLKDKYIDNLFNKSKEGVKIYYLEGYCDDSGYCNHGMYNTVIIDEVSNSIMFNYQKW